MILRLNRLASDDRGAAIIELALIAPMLALLIVGIVDMSNAFSRKLALEQGAHRAIEKIMQTTGSSTVGATLANEAVCQVNGTDSAGTCKTSPITASNVTVTYRLECTNVSSGARTTQVQTDPVEFDKLSCSATEKESRYVQVAITDKYTPMFSLHFSSFNSSDSTYHLSATAGTRIQ
jgi:Flp pilus assembly protein TadG